VTRDTHRVLPVLVKIKTPPEGGAFWLRCSRASQLPRLGRGGGRRGRDGQMVAHK